MNRIQKAFLRWHDRHRCKKTTVELGVVRAPGYRSMIRLRVIDKCNEMVLGEALYGPERMAEFCASAQDAINQIKNEYPEIKES